MIVNLGFHRLCPEQCVASPALTPQGCIPQSDTSHFWRFWQREAARLFKNQARLKGGSLTHAPQSAAGGGGGAGVGPGRAGLPVAGDLDTCEPPSPGWAGLLAGHQGEPGRLSAAGTFAQSKSASG
jgi:hypothetical protein